MFDYTPEEPKMNKVSSGLLAMNKAKAERNCRQLSKQNSVASHTATVSNDLDQEEDRFFEEGFERKPHTLFHQDSLVPRTTRSHEIVNPTFVDSSFFLVEEFWESKVLKMVTNVLLKVNIYAYKSQN